MRLQNFLFLSSERNILCPNQKQIIFILDLLLSIWWVFLKHIYILFRERYLNSQTILSTRIYFSCLQIYVCLPPCFSCNFPTFPATFLLFLQLSYFSSNFPTYPATFPVILQLYSFLQILTYFIHSKQLILSFLNHFHDIS